MLGRFEKAVEEIRAMKREIRDAHADYDDLELQSLQLHQNLNVTNTQNSSQSSLMTQRIQDLTKKLNQSEKQVNTAKNTYRSAFLCFLLTRRIILKEIFCLK